ncbi:MAG: enoyl-CoA hydratase [Beijerinckiaceae bacterium]
MKNETPARIEVTLQSRDGGLVATITVDNRAKLNTLGSALMRELIAAFEKIGARDDLRVVVLRGAGERAFIGGADILEMAELDPQSARAFITLLHRVCRAVRDLPVPVIARIEGYALGAGLEIAAACDLRVASSDAIFGMPEVTVGIPSVIEAAILPTLIGWGRTRELLLLGETIDAATGHAWGLVERLVEPAALDDAVETCVRSLLAAGPRAIRLQKTLMRQWEDLPLSDAIQAGIDTFVASWRTDEPALMLGAFRDRQSRAR